MEFKAKIKAKIHAGTFDGVPEDTTVTIFIPGVKHPLHGTLADCEIVQPEDDAVLVPKAKGMSFTLSMPVSWVGQDQIVQGMMFNNGMVSLDVTEQAPQVTGHDTVDLLKKAIPGIGEIRTSCPHCTDPERPKGPPLWWTGFGPKSWESPTIRLLDVIVHLNDYHRWSREEIASWLETKDWDLQFVTPVEETA